MTGMEILGTLIPLFAQDEIDGHLSTPENRFFLV